METRPVEVDPLIGTHVGEYRVEEKVGEGGMATVYRAVHPLIGKQAAIKVMAPALSADASAVIRFIHEARAVNQIGHPNIVDVFSFGRLPDGRSYFVMEYLQGESLYERMSHRRLSLSECLDVVDQVADALEAAHDKGIIHRDIKPANIFLVTRRGSADRVKLLDFGVAKLQAFELCTTQTRSGFVVGTPDYISPEQARSKPVDPRTDVYALGVVLYEMVLGQLPFWADNPMDMVRLHMTEPIPAPSQKWRQIPRPLERLMLAMLDKDPAGRPPPLEIRRAVKELRGDGMTTAILPRRRKLLDPRRVQMFAGAAFLALGLGLLAWSALHIAPDALPALMPAAKADPPRSDAPRGSRSMTPAGPSAAGKKGPHGRKKRLAAVREDDALLEPFGR